MNRRQGIMDATRTFEATDDASTTKKQQHIYDAIQESDRRLASGIGYGTKHPHHYRYFSRSMPPRPASPFDSHPQQFPTAAPLPPHRPLHHQVGEVAGKVSIGEREPYRSMVAPGIGYGPKHR